MNNLRFITELALIRAIPDLTIGDLKPSRLKGLFLKLQKNVDKDLAKTRGLTKDDLDAIWERVQEFGQATGWLEQKKHTGTLVSFCIEIIETSKFDFNPGILKTLNEIIEHFERGGDLKVQSCWAGAMAAEKWVGLFEKA